MRSALLLVAILALLATLAVAKPVPRPRAMARPSTHRQTKVGDTPPPVLRSHSSGSVSEASKSQKSVHAAAPAPAPAAHAAPAPAAAHAAPAPAGRAAAVAAAAKHPEITFEQAMNSQKFYAFAQREFSNENIDFIKAVENGQGSGDPANAFKNACTKYVTRGKLEAINLAFGERQAITTACRQNKYAAGPWVAAAKAIRFMVERDTYSRWKGAGYP
ncbi:hypothetical protein HDU96_004929 [Phlyctochytrium bullatum]|nr:hypothetical protein HDU96_004929 [Phlyctochytrium bullatum]